MPTSNSIKLPELLHRVDNDRALLRELLLLFNEEFPIQLRALQQAFAQSDWPTGVRISHSLKGMLSSLAMDAAAAHAARLEQLARAQDIPALTSAFAEFTQNVRSLLEDAKACASEVWT